MNNIYDRPQVRFIDLLDLWHDEHPYSLSFLIAAIFLRA